MVQLRSRRLVIRELPPAAGGKVARFIRSNWSFHRQWEPEREPEYFTARAHRRILRVERRADNVIHFWMLRSSSAPTGPEDRVPTDAPATAGLTRPGWRKARIVGSISLSTIVRGAFQSCFLGYKIGEKYARKGLMKEALVAVLDYAFTVARLHRVEANVIPTNEASLGLVRSLGFRSEGISRSYLKIAGRWRDHVHMVMLREEWQQQPNRANATT
jgi:ribosomal-protein-alanine N-acetyltransferase